MSHVPVEKIAALAVEKLTEALPNIESYSGDTRALAIVNVKTALALVSLLAEQRQPVMRDWGTGPAVMGPPQPLRSGTAFPNDAAGLDHTRSVIATTRANGEGAA